MDTKTIKKKLGQVFEDMGGGMVSSSFGLPGIEGGMDKKEKKKKDDNVAVVIKRHIEKA